jgi:LuxR family quorum sensing-dependent transcriptional regulator
VSALARLESNYYQLALGAIGRFDHIDSEVELLKHLSHAVSAFGYEHLCCACPPNGNRRVFEDSVLMNGWPKGWFEQYSKSNFYPHDPVVKFTRTQTKSFCWNQTPVSPDDKIAQSIMDIAAVDYRMRHGLCVPIHGVHGYQASVSFAGFEVEERVEAKSAVEIVAVYAFNRFNQLRSITNAVKVLTAREREVMVWIAAGKSAWDIGSILSVSEDTVNKTVASAMRRLNVYNRPQAVAESIRRGEISP